jgi:hypothetical protein
VSQSISVSDPTYALLRRSRSTSRLSPDALAERLLQERLSAEAAAWREALDMLISQVQSRTRRFNLAEIEADITAASDEVRELRRANRSD